MNLVNSFVNNAYRNNYVLLNKQRVGQFEINDEAYFDIDEKILESIDEYDTTIYNYVYVLSDVIANNLISKYFLDKKKGLIEIKNFITTMYQYSVLENLQRYGIDFEATENEIKMLYNYQKKKYYL